MNHEKNVKRSENGGKMILLAVVGLKMMLRTIKSQFLMKRRVERRNLRKNGIRAVTWAYKSRLKASQKRMDYGGN